MKKYLPKQGERTKSNNYTRENTMVDTSDFILLILAMFLFAMLQLGVTSVLLNNNKVMMNTELDYTAVALAQNIIDEARQKAFDQNTVGSYAGITVPDGFSTIGPETGEVYPNFNDFDDYHGYTRTDTTQFGIYTTECTVDYMNPDNLSQVSTEKTVHKRLLVRVTSETGESTAVTYIKSFY